MSTRRWSSFLLGPALFASVVSATDFASYRGFVFGADIISIVTLVGLNTTDAKLIHQRPARLREIEWKIPGPLLADPPRPDPVAGAVLCFFDGKLYRVIAAYDCDGIVGMTAGDRIETIPQTHGTARRPETELRLHSYFAEVAKVLARSKDSAYADDLVRNDGRTSFAPVLYAKAADELAQAAIQAATRRNALDVPRRAQEAENKRLEQSRLALEKSRAVNKPNFRP
ncbi:MAG TPA: hypothetical protein VFQ91_18765 [Bryobacteraceae bacterium]|nr:hypothetical protein [Bryobacteraceae bacterium]